MRLILSILIASALCIANASAADRWRYSKAVDKNTGKVTRKLVLRFPEDRLEITCEESKYFAHFYIHSGRLKAERHSTNTSFLGADIWTRLDFSKPERRIVGFEDSTHQSVQLLISVEDMIKAGFLLVGFEQEKGKRRTAAFVTDRLAAALKKLPCK